MQQTYQFQGTKRQAAILISSFFFFSSISCTKNPAYIIEKIESGNAQNQGNQYELVTIEQQAKEVVENFTTSFEVTPNEDNGAWTRARYFFYTYTDGKPQVSENKLTSDENSSDKVIFKITRTPSKRTVLYAVECLSKNSLEVSENDALMNAKNLARFIKNSEIEMSLIKGVPKIYK
jgi:hypothetical protein